jgi:tetratricopeptide (TPR) repeat protein
LTNWFIFFIFREKNHNYEHTMKFLRLILLFHILNYSFELCAQTNQVDSLILSGTEQSLRHDYAAAESTFKKLIDLDTNHPQGYFYLAATIQAKMMDFETDLWEKEFYKYIDETEQHCKELIETNNQNGWAYFYLGSAGCYRSFHESKKKEYLTAVRHGLAGVAALKKALQIDSTITEAYFGIGSFNYWRSKATHYLNWLPLLNDQRQVGIDMVKRAAYKSKYIHYAAYNELIWIFIDTGQPSEALKWARLGLSHAQDSRFFLWGAAKSHFLMKQYSEALLFYNQILNSVEKEALNNHYNEILCRYKMAQCYYQLKKNEETLALCDQILATSIAEPAVQKRLKSMICGAQELKLKVLIERSTFGETDLSKNSRRKLATNE